MIQWNLSSIGNHQDLLEGFGAEHRSTTSCWNEARLEKRSRLHPQLRRLVGAAQEWQLGAVSGRVAIGPRFMALDQRWPQSSWKLSYQVRPLRCSATRRLKWTCFNFCRPVRHFLLHPPIQKLFPSLAGVPISELKGNEEFKRQAELAMTVTKFIMDQLDNKEYLAAFLGTVSIPAFYVDYMDPVNQLDVYIIYYLVNH